MFRLGLIARLLVDVGLPCLRVDELLRGVSNDVERGQFGEEGEAQALRSERGFVDEEEMSGEILVGERHCWIRRKDWVSENTSRSQLCYLRYCHGATHALSNSSICF